VVSEVSYMRVSSPNEGARDDERVSGGAAHRNVDRLVVAWRANARGFVVGGHNPSPPSGRMVQADFQTCILPKVFCISTRYCGASGGTETDIIESSMKYTWSIGFAPISESNSSTPRLPRSA